MYTTLSTITPICTAHNTNGVDLYFLNKQNLTTYHNLTTTNKISHFFDSIKPTPMGTRLHQILKPYLMHVECEGNKIKPLNIMGHHRQSGKQKC